MSTELFLYTEDWVVKVSDIEFQIPEFREFRRYDTTTNKVFFYSAMSYIYYVYQVFGDDRSYMYNMSLTQRKLRAVKFHTGRWTKVEDFDDNKWVQKCGDILRDIKDTFRGSI